MADTKNSISTLQDITFIGSGIATSYTLIPLLKELEGNTKRVKITIIEKSEEYFTGLAYGKRSGSTALLITSLADFLPVGEERNNFILWLSHHKDALIKELLDEGGVLTKNWVNTHKEDIKTNNWEDVYIPRRFFGKYIKQKLRTLVNNSQSLIDVNFITDEAIKINVLSNQNYSILLKETSQNIKTKKVVLSVGIPPVKKLWTQAFSDTYKATSILINDPYGNGLKNNLNEIKEKASTASNKLNILIIGSNASAMEMIYKTNDIIEIRDQINNITVISPQGELPNSAKDEHTKKVIFKATHLHTLRQNDELRAKEIYDAAQKDLDVAEEKGYSAAITEIPVSEGFKTLLPKLSKDELKVFACHYGNEIGKRQRRAGNHYTNVVDNLISKGSLNNIKGYFVGLQEDSDGNLTFSFREKDSEHIIVSEHKVDIVFNCTGGKTLASKNISPIIDDVLEKKICTPNESNRGFNVDENLQASPNFYIAGPLLAGNIINGQALWHIEHCGRIIYLGKELAKRLVKEG